MSEEHVMRNEEILNLIRGNIKFNADLVTNKLDVLILP